MGILSGLADWLSDLWDKIKSIVKKIWPLILIALIVFWPPAGVFLAKAATWIGGLVETYGIGTVLLGAFGIYAAIDPDGASDVVENVGEVLGTVGEVAGSVAGSTLSGFLTSPGGLILLGVGAFFLLTRSSGKSSSGSSDDSESDSGDTSSGLKPRPVVAGGET